MHKYIFLLGLFFNYHITYAATPVVDYLAIDQIILTINELEKHYRKMEDQLKEAQMQTSLISGENTFSDLYNSNTDKRAREWAPDSIEEFEDMVESGFNPGDLSDRYAYYQAKFPAVELDKIDAKNPNSPQRNLYAYNEDWTKLNLVGFAETFDAVNYSYERINNLLDEMNHQDTLKQSSDFSNRLLGELGYLLQQLIQVQNFEMHTNAMLQQAELNHLASHTHFYTFRKN